MAKQLQPIVLDSRMVLEAAYKAIKAGKLQALSKEDVKGSCAYASGPRNQIVCVIGSSLPAGSTRNKIRKHWNRAGVMILLDNELVKFKTKRDQKFLLDLQNWHDVVVNTGKGASDFVKHLNKSWKARKMPYHIDPTKYAA